MRAQAFEKMNEKLIEELFNCIKPGGQPNVQRIENLIAKSKILSDRDDDRAASVIRELNNGN